MSQPDFNIAAVWNAIQKQLKADLAQDIDVDCIGEEDFDEEGALTLRLPAARVLFLEEADEAVESQNMAYRSGQRFAVLCAGQSLEQDPQSQRDASLHVVRKVKDSLIGARLVLGNGQTSDPVRLLGTRPMAISIGMAYVIALQVDGTASFPAPHAVPVWPEQGENNG